MDVTTIYKRMQFIYNKVALQLKKNKTVYSQKIGRYSLSAILLIFCLLIMTACSSTGTEKKASREGSTDQTSVEALSEVNAIPEDGIITKEQFATVAGQDKQIQFTGKADDISYVWTFDAKQIQNPEDQNLKIVFTTNGLDDIKKAANNANDALKMTMAGQGMICVPTLTVTLPESWQSDTGLLLKEQDGQLAKMSDVTIESQPAAQQEYQSEDAASYNELQTKNNNTEASGTLGVGTTILTMKVTSLDGDCYVVGGITDRQNKGTEASNRQNPGAPASGSDKMNKNNEVVSDGDSDQELKGDDSSESVKNNDVKNEDVKNEDIVNDGNGNSAGGISSGDKSSNSKPHTCTISINCSTILNNMDKLTSGKEEFVPSDGWILPATTVEFTEGDSVHDVLQAVCKANGIHMESSYTPMYDTAYVEGINQLYEFDCGELSGWMYNVNGWFPNYGCSKYTVSDGDVINWIYTCDLGKDVGDNSMY